MVWKCLFIHLHQSYLTLLFYRKEADSNRIFKNRIVNLGATNSKDWILQKILACLSKIIYNFEPAFLFKLHFYDITEDQKGSWFSSVSGYTFVTELLVAFLLVHQKS